MQIENQSQTNTKTQGRDAAIQISGEAQTTENLPGYVCKRCGGVAPVGVGYAAGSWARDEARTSCDCGYSVKASACPSCAV